VRVPTAWISFLLVVAIFGCGNRVGSADVANVVVSAEEETVAEPVDVPSLSENARTLRGFILLTLDAATTVITLTELFGEPRVGAGGDFVFEQSLEGVRVLKIHARRNQNREILDRVTIHFSEESQPTVTELAARLETAVPPGPVEVRSTCTHGNCPAVALEPTFVAGAPPTRLSFAIAHERLDIAGQRFTAPLKTNDPAELRVESLTYSILGTTCPRGRAVPEPVTFGAPTTAAEKLLASSLAAAARELAGDRYDPAVLEKALGVALPRDSPCCRRTSLPFIDPPFPTTLGGTAKLIFDENAMTHITWVQFAIDRRASVAPFAVPGFRYAADPETVCRIWGSGKHVFELAEGVTNAPQFRVFLTMTTARDTQNGGPAGLTFISLERFPIDWEKVTF
jgi:hypothetical protein